MTAPQWDFADPYLWPVTVEAAHIDALAHTRNTHYVEWCMEAAWAHTTALGLGEEDYQRLDRAMALTHAEYDYLKATRAGDQLLVGTWITAWAGKMKMTRRLQVVCERDRGNRFSGRAGVCLYRDFHRLAEKAAQRIYRHLRAGDRCRGARPKLTIAGSRSARGLKDAARVRLCPSRS